MPNKRLLVVDDEVYVRTYIKQVLLLAGYEAIEADNGASALEIVRNLGGVDLLVSDIRMPVMDGVALAQVVRIEFPSVPLLLISGEPLETSPFEFLPKPFLPAALLEAVSRVIESGDTARSTL